MSDHESLRLAFIEIAVFEDGALRGGMLVTDEKTRPYEFRVTSAIKPTSMQTIVYGQTLKEYIYTDLIGLPLLKSAQEPISLGLSRDANILATRPNLDFPIVYLKKAASTDHTRHQVMPVVHEQFHSEEPWVQSVLSGLPISLDLLEPFERIKTALVEVHRLGPEDRRADATR